MPSLRKVTLIANFGPSATVQSAFQSWAMTSVWFKLPSAAVKQAGTTPGCAEFATIIEKGREAAVFCSSGGGGLANSIQRASRFAGLNDRPTGCGTELWSAPAPYGDVPLSADAANIRSAHRHPPTVVKEGDFISFGEGYWGPSGGAAESRVW